MLPIELMELRDNYNGCGSPAPKIGSIEAAEALKAEIDKLKQFKEVRMGPLVTGGVGLLIRHDGRTVQFECNNTGSVVVKMMTATHDEYRRLRHWSIQEHFIRTYLIDFLNGRLF